VLNARQNRLAELRDIFYGDQLPSFETGYDYDIPGLNEVQNEAFRKVTHASDIALIHGPPGTGKTTTLVNCIKEAVRVEKQVLACAASNAAVDLLVEKLVIEGLNVLRLGHPARLTPDVIENSLDVKISKHVDFKRLRGLRQRSEEFRKLAKKYKRQYGKSERIQRMRLFDEAKALKAESRNLEEYITDNLIDNADVIACTLTGSNQAYIKERMFKTVFIDEASQALEAASWIPLNRAKRVIMAGDHFQLPPTIKSYEAAKEGLEITLFQKAISNQRNASIMLQTQYRMHPLIMGFSSSKFYEDALKVAETISQRKNEGLVPLEFHDTAGAGYEEMLKEETLSTMNKPEAEYLVKRLEEEDLSGRTIGIIAPYKAQIEYLSQLVNSSDDLAPFREQISINTVDSFQGQERDFVFISLTRSNKEGNIGFLKEYRRTNVALTRAKHRLFVVGDSATLSTDLFYNDLIVYIQKHGEYKSVFEYQCS
jgi:superfamily I DNA and/or RNA helicase